MNGDKIAEINLERGHPTVEEALRELVSALMTCKGKGCKGVVLIHGYGSSGAGGKICLAVRMKLRDASLSGIVRASCAGEHWTDRKREMITFCPQLSEKENRIAGNHGVTVVILK